MNGEFAFFSTDFGIIKFNIARKEFSDTYYLDNQGGSLIVHQTTILGDSIFAATDSGIRKAYLNDPSISFYNSWKHDLNLPLPNASYSIVSSYSDKLFVNLSMDDIDADTLYMKDGKGDWNSIPAVFGLKNLSVVPNENQVLISHGIVVSVYDSTWSESTHIDNFGINSSINVQDAIFDKEGMIWMADNSNGLVHQLQPGSFEFINPAGPFFSGVDGVDIRNNRMWIATGSRNRNWTNSYSNDGVIWRNSDLNWGLIDKFNDKSLVGVFDFVDIKMNPFDASLTYGVSIGGGVIEFKDYSVSNVFNSQNTILQEQVGYPGWVVTTGLDFDANGNLWVANSQSDSPIVVYTKEKEWKSYSFNSLTRDVTGPLIVTKNGQKWVLFSNAGKGILVFDDGGTISDLSDDQFTILSSVIGSGALPTNSVYSIAEDKEGQIWVGTSEGVAIFNSPGNIFSTGVNYDAYQIVVEVDGYTEYLLSTQIVTAIAVDAANRKWFGTDGSGVFFMSADGKTQLANFTAENSPLLSNFIRCIDINEVTGEVVFGTDEGIIAYKGSATGTQAISFGTFAYPNPVLPDYSGLIYVRGLALDSEVRITDSAGHLVFTTRCEVHKWFGMGVI